ncbi:M13 family metallopeptidase [Aliikangiella sp. IMCC44359]|uniref:M13 family metallopeptidase n=1 Tax=Aliikangiella sp. IMCC44359 TaxID=3459125 RepID=UPI00403AFECA
MKKQILASAICLALITSCGQQESSTKPTASTDTKDPMKQQTPLKSGIELANMDKTVRPQDDFYRYVNGAWLDKTEIPADKSSYGSFTALRDKSRRDVKAIIEETAQLESVDKGSDAQKVGDLYRSFMDVEKLNQLHITPLNDEFRKIEALKSHDDISAYFAESQIIGSDAPFGFWINNDSKNPTEYIMYLTQSGLGLPDREYYLKTEGKSVKIREAYVAHIAKIFNLAGLKNSQELAQKVMGLETSIAQIHWSLKDNRDRNKTYTKYTFDQLSEFNADLKNDDARRFNWSTYFDQTGIKNPKALIVRQPTYIKNFAKLFATTSVSDWQTYFKWTLINANASRLSSEFDKANFNFYGTILNGTPQQEERWKRAVSTVNNLLGEVVGKIYVKKYFKPEAKARMVTLVENLREAYRQAIIELDWMGEDTKKQALDKLAKFTPKIGYPDKWRDYSSLNIEPSDLVGNYLRAAKFNYNREINKLGQPIDKTEWFMSPQTVNAYYNPSMNEIVFPAAILQPPFFYMEADDAVNYGAIGGVIGHEMGHGFDDQGAKSDGDGILRNWWTEKDLEEFKLRTSKLAEQFSQFEPLPGEHIQGELTLGENIGDLGGLTIAHRAYMLSLKDKPAPVIDGLAGEERFFMGWAQVWAYKFRDEALSNMLQTDPHSPGPYRGNGTLMNMPEFMKAYNIKPGDKMYRKPEERVKIW